MIRSAVKSLSIIIVSFSIACNTLSMGYPYMRDKILSLSVSSFAPTRIFFDFDKIIDVFYYPKNAINLNIHASGFVYIIPASINSLKDKSVYITIVSRDGHVQDLKLNFKNREPGPIRIVCDKYCSKQTKIIQNNN